MDESSSNNLQDQIAAKIPSSEFIFMNHGYSDSSQPMSLEGLDAAEISQSHCIAFLQFLFLGELVNGKTLLEIGSGRGGNCRYLAKHTGATQIFGLEYCAGHVEFSNQNHSFDHLTFLQGDAHALPFEDESFDYVLSMEASHCYSDLNLFLGEVRRVLKPRGKMVYTDIVMTGKSLSFTQAIQKSGLKLVTQKDITDRIAQSIFENRDRVENLLRGSIEESLSNRSLIESLIRKINVTAYDGYLAGEATYQFWKLQK